jgi:serine/threonine-protein kinase RsbW
MGDATEFKVSALADLDRLVAFVARACERAGVDADSRFALRLAVEESFINIMQHGYGAGGGPMRVDLQREGNRITIVMRDQGRPFDPTTVPAPDLDADWQQRTVGGLGVHLMQKMMDEVRYERNAGRENVLTLVKEFRGEATRS